MFAGGVTGRDVAPLFGVMKAFGLLRCESERNGLTDCCLDIVG